MKYRTEGKPAPKPLVIVQGFLNTWSDELGIEDFHTTQSTQQWLSQAGLWQERKRLSVPEMNELKEFRKTLRKFVLVGACQENMVNMNELASGIGFRVKFFEHGNAELVVSESRVTKVIGTLIGIIYTSLTEGSWSRFKCCELETCGWAFYDYTKNQSGRWCSMKTCGSRHKARQYLKRKAQRA
ncbi:MAG: hypothetical protein GXP16_08105 [Gammaproteobacteria bacterium]|nr:hypothetical protein [Gammaproteobacteria bacterium]